MRVWADFFDINEVLQGTGIDIISATVERVLDDAGSFTLTFPQASNTLFNLAQVDHKIQIWLEQDEQVRFFGGGVIRDLTVDGSGSKITVAGPSYIDALTHKSVLLGRAYEVADIGVIASDLISLVPPWSITVSENALQTVRFDGISVYKALLSIAAKAGLHVREGETPNTLEMGAFGEETNIKALHPEMLSIELLGRDDVLLIDKITQKSTSRDIVNWIIPVGAGEGEAAVTLRDCINVTPEQMTGPDGRTLYFIKDDDSIAAYGQHERVLSFKDIVPPSNTGASRAYASELLYAAAQAVLERLSQPLTIYTLSVKKNRTDIRPGNKIRIAYKGTIDTDKGTHTPIDVNGMFWVMKTNETVNTSGISMTMEIASVDRVDRDLEQAIIETMEAIEIRNLSPQTHTVWINKSDRDYVWASASVADANWKYANFELTINDKVTDILSVKLRFKTEAGGITGNVTTSTTFDGKLYAQWTNAPYLPDQLTLAINGENVTSEFNGPWGTFNTPANAELDITDKIRQAVGGMYKTHTFQFACVNRSAERTYPPHSTSVGNGASGGIVRIEIDAQLIVKD